MPDHFREPGRQWARGAVAAAPVDARPRPRLTWAKRTGWCLRYGDASMGSIGGCDLGHNRISDIAAYNLTAGGQPTHHTSVRDAAINLRLRFIAAGFDVDDVPAEILGGGK